MKAANEKILLENYGKVGNQNLLEKRINDLVENEKKLMFEIEEMRTERDAKTLEFHKKIERETENLRLKIRELELKYKDSENKKNMLIFDHEKEKAKWNVEKDYLSSQASEL